MIALLCPDCDRRFTEVIHAGGAPSANSAPHRCPACGGSGTRWTFAPDDSSLASAPRPAFARRLRRVLKDGLSEKGIEARIEIERVKLTSLYRVAAWCDHFATQQHSERQELLWGIVKERLGPEGELGISMMLAFAPWE